MNEVYLGPDDDRAYIATYLDNIRRLDPIEIAVAEDPVRLSDTQRLHDLVNVDLLWEVIDRGLADIRKRYSVTITPLAPTRCYTAQPPEPRVLGGFHDHRSLGYQFWYHASFVFALNPSLASRDVRTIELARSFVHDSLHHSTFRSYRRALRLPSPSPKVAKHRVPEIYREQYGINFRNRDGSSYSSPELTARSPESINLNVLMDGVIVLLTADALKPVCEALLPAASHLERQLLSEIMLTPFDLQHWPDAHSFVDTVVTPTARFVTHWGGDHLVRHLLTAMTTGDLGDIKQFFAERLRASDAWEKTFKTPQFSLDPTV